MQIRLSAVLLRYTDNTKVVSIEASTAGEALAELCQRHPGLQSVLFDADGTLSRLNRVYVGDEPLTDLTQPVAPDDVIQVMTAVAGG